MLLPVNTVTAKLAFSRVLLTKNEINLYVYMCLPRHGFLKAEMVPFNFFVSFVV